MNGFFSSAARWIGSAWNSHWKIIVSVAAGAVIAIAATALIIGTCGTAAPVLFAAAGASGALSAGTTQTVDDLLEHKRPGLDVAESVVIGGAVSVATFGAGRLIAPYVPEALATMLPGQALPPLESDAHVVTTALRRNIPWGSIPRVIFNQTIPQLAQEAEVGIVGALSGAKNRAAPRDTSAQEPSATAPSATAPSATAPGATAPAAPHATPPVTTGVHPLQLAKDHAALDTGGLGN